MVKLKVKVVPGASRSEVSGWLGEMLKIRVAAPAEKGKANSAVQALLCDALGVPGNRVRLAAGGGSPKKVFEISGMSQAEVKARLKAAMQ